MSKESVAVIVPIYNVEKYIKKCIESIIEQTYEYLEIMLIDDGSPDNCGKIIDDYAKKDSRIKAIHKPNGGYGSVLQYGIKNMKSNYFIICDSDDWLEKNCIETLYNSIIETESDIAIGSKYLVYNDGRKVDNTKNDFYNIESNKKYTDLSLFTLIPPSPHSKLYKKSIAQDIIFPGKVSYTDLLLYFVSLSNSQSVVYVNQPLSNYFIDRPGNTMTDYEEKGVAPFLLAFCALEFIISHKKINFVIVIRRESPETKGIHCSFPAVRILVKFE